MLGDARNHPLLAGSADAELAGIVDVHAGIEPHLLYPMKTWKDKAAFDQTARKLVRMFQENFVKYEKHVDADVRSAAPEVRLAAE